MVKCLSALALLALSGCASYSDKVATGWSHPVLYAKYDCEMLSLEQQRVTARVTELGHEVDQTATGDVVKTAVGLAVFPPLLMFLSGHTAIEREYALIKGQQQAIQIAAIQRKCWRDPTTVGQAPKAAATL